MRRQRVVEPVAAADHRHVERVHRCGEGERQFGVGLLLVGGVAVDRGVPCRPCQPLLGDRVEVADQSGRLEPGGECVVEAAVDREHDGVVGDAGHDLR